MLYEDAIDAISASTLLKIGWLGEDGTILWHTNAGSIIPFPAGGVYVQLGTLAAADATLSSFWVMLHKRRSMPARASISRPQRDHLRSARRRRGHRQRRHCDFDPRRAEFPRARSRAAAARLQRQRVADRCPAFAPLGFATAPPVGCPAAAYASGKNVAAPKAGGKFTLRL